MRLAVGADAEVAAPTRGCLFCCRVSAWITFDRSPLRFKVLSAMKHHVMRSLVLLALVFCAAAAPDVLDVGKSECDKRSRRKSTLKLIKETPFSGLFRDLKNSTVFEASGESKHTLWGSRLGFRRLCSGRGAWLGAGTVAAAAAASRRRRRLPPAKPTMAAGAACGSCTPTAASSTNTPHQTDVQALLACVANSTLYLTSECAAAAAALQCAVWAAPACCACRVNAAVGAAV
jgi:hypothetical protein